MDSWTVVRYLHLVGILFFVGGQLLLVAAVAPVLRRAADDGPMRAIARRFGIGSGVALAVVVATGVAMASRFDLWDDRVLHAKLAVLVLVAVLVPLHVMSTGTRAISAAMVAGSLFAVWLGVELTYG